MEELKYKPFRSNIYINFYDLGLANAFLDTTSKAHPTKNKMKNKNTEKFNFIKMNNFCSANNTIDKVKNDTPQKTREY